MTTDWNPLVTVPMYQEQRLVRMVQLAKHARKLNISREENRKRYILEKTKLIQSGDLQYTRMCTGSQLRPEQYSIIDNTNLALINASDVSVNDQDLLIGFMTFSTLIYCSESVALTQFLHSLLSTQSPRTIIQATVNTIQSDNIKEKENRKRMAQFYAALDNIFNLQFGKILLATASLSQLEDMMAKDLPYFAKYSHEIDQCIKNASCQKVVNLIQTLGKH